MSAQANVAPVIIKRKKVVSGDGHHGGAWKVAYADFVTAMMAFFLLMWLLNATTEKQRKGIADYFSPTIPINRISGGGDGDFGGQSVFSEDQLPQNGTGATNLRPTEAQQARGETGVDRDGSDGGAAQERAQQDAEFKAMEEALMGRGGESTVAKELKRHIVTRVTDEGLIIELFDLPGSEMFAANSADATPLLEALAGIIAEVSRMFENKIAVEGHIRAMPIVLEVNPVWDLSSARANRVRLLLEGEGLGEDRVMRITGHADREPTVRNPMAIRNNRIEVVLLRAAR